MNESKTSLYPLLFKPVYQDYLWGGNGIARQFDRDVPPGVIAESWEISGHPDGESVIANGTLAGKTLAEVVADHGADLLGTRVAGREFPLLIKLLDAADRLSVQVHPNDETAARYGGQAKTEMWYLVHADPGAAVFAGLAPGTTQDRFRQAIADNEFDAVLTAIPVETGDAIFIPGGRVHAIDRGCMILEVQQSSNTTYRIYDWGRVGADGKGRDLHIEKAAEVTLWDDDGDPKVVPQRIEAGEFGERWEIYTSPYFRMERLALHGNLDVSPDPETFQALFCAEGSVEVSSGEDVVLLKAGTSCLLPASLPGYRIQPVSGEAMVLRITVP